MSGRRARSSKPPSAPRVRPLDAARRAQVEAHGYLAYQWAWRFHRRCGRGMPADELIAEALFGLVYAAGMYDPKREVPFTAYASLVLRHRLERAVINWRRTRRAVSISRRSRTDDDPWEVEDIQPEADLARRTTMHEMCERVRRVMPARSYQILSLYYAEGFTLEEIGARFGLTRQRVRQVLVKAVEKARRHVPEALA